MCTRAPRFPGPPVPAPQGLDQLFVWAEVTAGQAPPNSRLLKLQPVSPEDGASDEERANTGTTERGHDCEFAIRPYIEHDRDRVYARLRRWAKDRDYRVRAWNADTSLVLISEAVPAG